MRTIFISSLCFLTSSLLAQSPVRITTERESGGVLVLYAENNTCVPHTVQIVFSELENMQAPVSINDPHETVVFRGRQQLLRLRPEGGAPRYRFSSLSFRGNLKEKADTNYVYLLPAAPDKGIRPGKLVRMEKFLGKQSSGKSTGISVPMTEGDTVFACRGGIVSEMKESYEPEEKDQKKGDGRVFSTGENFVEIYHKDGSFMRYTIFEKDRIFVEPGDRVYPGQPLGIVGGKEYRSGPHVRLSTYFLKRVPREDSSFSSSRAHSFLPVFYLGENKQEKLIFNEEYTVPSPPVAFITSEMSKSERKKYLKAQKKNK